MTAHRSQGKTVDSVILSGDGMQKELFYVAASVAAKASRHFERQGAAPGDRGAFNDANVRL